MFPYDYYKDENSLIQPLPDINKFYGKLYDKNISETCENIAKRKINKPVVNSS